MPLVLVPFLIWKRAYRVAACFITVAVCVVGLWTLRNFVVLDDFITVSASFGSAFMQGSDERFYQEKIAAYPAFLEAAAQVGIAKPVGATSSKIDRWMFRLGIWSYQQQTRQHGMLSVIGMIGRKFIKMWYLTEGGNIRSELMLGFCSLLVVPLGLVELVSQLRSGDSTWQLLTITVGYWILIHILVVPIVRYMLPILAILILAASVRVCRVIQTRFSSWRPRPDGIAVA
jgi:hypothetical protein